MDFLFLNESASASNGEMEAWLESTYGVSGQTDKNQSLGDFMLDYQEAMHEAEIQSMKDEFRLYQEEAAGVMHEGVIDTLKNWWRKLVEWITKAWNKILHWIEVAYAFIRKKVQEWYMKLRNRKIIYMRTGIDTSVTEFTNYLQNEVEKDTGIIGKTLQLSADLNKSASDQKDEMKEAIKDAYEAVKDKWNEIKDRYNDAGDKQKDWTETSIEKWKKAVDGCVKAVDKARQARVKAKAAMFKTIKEIEKGVNDATKAYANKDSHTDAEREDYKKLVRQGELSKLATTGMLKLTSLYVSAAKWALSKTINSARSTEKDDLTK